MLEFPLISSPTSKKKKPQQQLYSIIYYLIRMHNFNGDPWILVQIRPGMRSMICSDDYELKHELFAYYLHLSMSFQDNVKSLQVKHVERIFNSKQIGKNFSFFSFCFCLFAEIKTTICSNDEMMNKIKKHLQFSTNFMENLHENPWNKAIRINNNRRTLDER